MIKCPNCSAELEFDVTSQEIKCKYCGSTFDPQTYEIKVQKAEEHDIENEEESFEGKSYCCSQCGATLLSFDETAITFCSYCGSQAMIESKMVKVNNPDFIIPFQKTKEECIKNYRKAIRWKIFAPSYMKSKTVIEKFRGIYMPYVVYYISYHNNCSNVVSKRTRRKGDYVYYNDYAMITKVDTEYVGLSYDLISKYYDKYSLDIPFNFEDAQKFNFNYLSGFYADTKDVDNHTFDKIVENFAQNDSGNKLIKKIPEMRKYQRKKISVPVKIDERKTGIFPVYFVAVRDEKHQSINYAVINGQTGKVATDVPIDFKKYLLLTILVSIGIFLLIDNYILILPKNILIIALIASFVSLIISNTQLNRINVKRNHLDDLGYVSQDKKEYADEIDTIIQNEKNGLKQPTENPMLKTTLFIPLIVLVAFIIMGIMTCSSGGTTFQEYVSKALPMFFTVLFIFLLFFAPFGLMITLLIKLSNKMTYNKQIITQKGKMPFGIKITKYLYKQLISIMISIYILYTNPVDDKWYYGGAIACFFFVVFSFYDLVKERNDLISNKLPQLEKRGGDEND